MSNQSLSRDVVLAARHMMAADWYIKCLEDVQKGRVVAGLAEAKAGYHAACKALDDA